MLKTNTKIKKKDKRSVLITGGAGFIGSNFVHYWRKNFTEDKLFILDELTYAGNLENIKEALRNDNCVFIKGNICNESLVTKLLREHQIDTIVNFAAESHVDRSITGAKDFIETNIVGTFSLLAAAKKVWLDGESTLACHHFHHVSTDEVYGSLSTDEAAFTEEHQYQPNSPYSASKAASDHLVRAYHHTYGLNVTTSNCSNNYGPFHYPEKLIPLAILNLLHNQKVPIYGDGKQVRDWLHVKDHCAGISQIIKTGRCGEVYNIGGNNEWQNIDIILLICALLEQKFKENSNYALKYPLAEKVICGRAKELISYVTDRAGHDRRYAIDDSKIVSELDFNIEYDFKTGLEETIHWYLNNSGWWQPLYSVNKNMIKILK